MYIERKSPAKYRNVRQTYKGYAYHSKAEANYAMYLDSEKQAGRIKDWERQYKVELRANRILICNYYVDFRVLNNDDSYELVEVKGYSTDLYRMKRKLLEALWLPEHLDHKYTVIKV